MSSRARQPIWINYVYNFSLMNIHLIAIGGAIMHNLALELADNGHNVTGSDDQIFEPALSRLKAKNLLPSENGWYPERVHSGLDLVILGMHARADNPELQKALALGITVRSFPEFMYDMTKDKIRVVIAGSHGKTTTTSMLMHILRSAGLDFDYLVGAQLEGFNNMVRISNAPIAVFEGDEYTASPLDLRPKFLHYRPHISIITGIAWDHINVFETHEKYIRQFELLIEDTLERGKVIYFSKDTQLADLMQQRGESGLPYVEMPYVCETGQCSVIFHDKRYPVHFFGAHNFQNLQAAYYAASLLGVTDDQFLSAINNMPGPARRLEIIHQSDFKTVYYDFAHAPSKVEATVKAVREFHPGQKITGIFEMHTFSSLNPQFIQQYAHTLDDLDEAIIFYDPDTVRKKHLQDIPTDQILKAFKNENIKIIQTTEALREHLKLLIYQKGVLLLMTSGNFGGINIRGIDWE